jgi:hypothetical protein
MLEISRETYSMALAFLTNDLGSHLSLLIYRAKSRYSFKPEHELLALEKSLPLRQTHPMVSTQLRTIANDSQFTIIQTSQLITNWQVIMA